MGCTACNVSDAFFCPGFTRVPVANTMYGLTDQHSQACPSFEGNFSFMKAGDLLHGGATGSSISGLRTVDAVIIAGIVVGAMIIAGWIVARKCTCKCARKTEETYEKIDLFSKNVWVPDGEAQVRKKRPIGGFYSLLGLTGFVMAAGILIATRAETNIMINKSANILGSREEKAITAYPFRKDEIFGSGIQLRVTASGDSDACTPLTSTYSGFSKSLGSSDTSGKWELVNSTSNCGGAGASQVIYQCKSCSLSKTSQLVMTFHFSCQAFDVQLGALDAEGVLTTQQVAFAAADNSGRITTIEVSADVFYSFVNDTRSGKERPDMRGYAVANAAYAVNGASSTAASKPMAPLGRTSNTSLYTGVEYATIIPFQNTVTVTVKLPISVIYSVVVISEKITIGQLLASIAGIASVIGIAAKVLSVNDAIERKINEKKVGNTNGKSGDDTASEIAD